MYFENVPRVVCRRVVFGPSHVPYYSAVVQRRYGLERPSVGLAVWIALRAFRAPDRVRGGFRGAPGNLPGAIPETFWTSPEGFGGRF